jgi:DeoR family glycerol-3-phosphate regulon repressor
MVVGLCWQLKKVTSPCVKPKREVQIRRAIIANCRESFLVLDHEKFGRIAHVRGGQIEEGLKVFCDQNPPNEIIQILDDSESQLIICDKEEV